MKLKTAMATAAIMTAGLALTGCATSPDGGLVCVVDDKDRTTDSEGASVYRVYTSGDDGCGVFNIEDALFLGKLNSADLYGSLEVGKTYSLTTYGYRNGFFSMFPNITEATEVSE
ncbi:hypothetical protein ACFVAJ_17470 [Agromyces sp. NPDC057679]|uniref:hypothetical protein n=1 Tax=Agromyces sp. NPDC057679 TaxID=3346207 RepID=UPI00366C1767